MNQLGRRHRAEMRRLLQAGASLRKAHEKLLAGGKQGELRAAAERERALVAGLVERAEPLLSEAGTPSPANLERVRNTLHAVATDEELRAELEAGRVLSDRESVGLGPFAAASPARSGGPTSQKEQKHAAARRRALRETRVRAERAAKQLGAAEAALERARDDAEQAHRELRARERSLEAARKEAEAAEEELGRVESSQD